MANQPHSDLDAAASSDGASDPALTRSEFIQQTIESAQEGIIALDHELRYVLWNPFMVALTGFKQEELLGKHPWDVFTFVHERGIDQILLKALTGESGVIPDTLIKPAAGGRPTWVSSKVTPLQRNGKIFGVLVVVRDVTLRKRAEEQLRAAEARFKSVIEHSHETVLLLDATGKKTYVSPGISRISGYGVAEYLSTQTFAIVHPDDIPLARQTLQQVTQAPNTLIEAEIRIMHKDGSVHCIQVVANNLVDVPGVNSIVVNLQDITDRKRAEAERTLLQAQLQHAQRLESLGVLAGGIAHEFNNLLAEILGNAELAQLEMPQGNPARKRIDDIRSATIRAAELTRQMLAYSGRGKFVIETFSLNAIIQEMAHLLQASTAKQAILDFKLSKQAPIIDADATQIRQVIMNLLINASEALAGNPGTITLSTGFLDADAQFTSQLLQRDNQLLAEGRYAYIEVSDTGCGMDRETRAKIFDPFFSTKFTGRGLGLAAVLGIVRGHKGAIGVNSAPGEGTSFKLFIPVSIHLESAHTTVSSSRHAQNSRCQELILVIDDEESLRTVLKHNLERFGFQVITATDGQDGINLYRSRVQEIAAVILDMTMPNMNGEKTYAELRRIHSEVRVLLTSGYNEQEATQRFAATGLAGFIQKPFQTEALIEQLRAILGA